MQVQKSQIPEVLMSLKGQGSSEEERKENNTATRRDRNNSVPRRAQKRVCTWEPEMGGCQSHSLLDYAER